MREIFPQINHFHFGHGTGSSYVNSAIKERSWWTVMTNLWDWFENTDLQATEKLPAHLELEAAKVELQKEILQKEIDLELKQAQNRKR